MTNLICSQKPMCIGIPSNDNAAVGVDGSIIMIGRPLNGTLLTGRPAGHAQAICMGATGPPTWSFKFVG